MIDTIQRTEPATIRANGIDLCYDTFGDPAAPPMLLIMGLGGQLIHWDDAFCAELARHGFRVIRFDNRDIGLSTKLSHLPVPTPRSYLFARILGRLYRAPYRLSDMADDAAGLMDALGIRAAHVVGVSMGGMIAQQLAVDHPARVLTLTSIMSSTGNPWLPGPTREAAAMLLEPVPHDIEAFEEHHARLRRVLRRPGFPEDEAKDASLGARVFRRGLNPPGVARQLLAIVASGNRTKALGTLRAPTLVIHGDNDALVPLKAGQATARAIPGAELMVVRGMGHALPMSTWPQIIGAIARHAGAAAREAASSAPSTSVRAERLPA